ncbi:progonadoliberin-1-like [Parambassis ranga]|uniref:Progonadoliberin-1-like n=1 Tax=Parambassis ranga TaxID=210632 RepID=A0A6P7J0N0_9TELE|nr:progonadoliberin-1 [Parambassis ranga]
MFYPKMDGRSLMLWLLLMGAVLPQGCSQHWSYGLSPGGKRELDSFSDTLGDIVEGIPHVDTVCGVLACAEESPFTKIFRRRGLLGSVTDRENGQPTYKK